MCGIAGCVNFDRTPIAQDLLARIGTHLAHRGPDGQGIYNKEGAALIHRRLSIIDLSSAGDQPMTNEDQSIWITYNGEIYNFQEIKSELLARGHRFHSNTDTEVIIHGYEEWGPRVCERLRGMFAYAIWDEPKRQLVLARDRLGQKPIVYASLPNGFAFSSETHALLDFPGIVRQPNLTALHAYLQRVYVPSPLTAFQGICKLPPAHFMVVQDGRIQIEKYWQLEFEPKNPGREADLAPELFERLREAVRIRLMSDVPLGAFLSGGIDSSAVVGLMSREMSEPVRTFSIRFDHDYHDETGYARRVSKLFETDHQEFLVKPDALSILPELIRHYGEPFGDYSSIPTYYVSKMTRQSVTVALSGDAGDEHFAGYGRYRTAYWLNLAQWLPTPVRIWVMERLSSMIGALPLHGNQKHQLQTVLRRAAVEPARAYHYSYSFFTPEAAAALWMPEHLKNLDPDYLFNQLKESLATGLTGPLDTWLKMDLESYLPDDINVKVDIASMAHSLEVRSPFMDHKLAEFAATLPENMKRRGLKTKHILKSALRGFLPDDILFRKKHGFSVPMAEWLRGEMSDFMRGVLLDPGTRARGIFQPQKIEKLVDEHVKAERDHSMRLWLLLNTELWYRAFIDESQ